MMQSTSASFYFPTNACDALSTAQIGKLTTVLTQDEVAAPFTMLDCFDQSLRRSNRLLVNTGTAFALFLPDGRMVSQPAKRNGQFVADFEGGAVKQALADLSPLRSLQPIGSGNLRHAVLALLDNNNKTHGRAYLHTLTAAEDKTATLIRLQGLRGYDKAFANLRKHVEACGGTALNSGQIYADLFPDLVGYDAKPEVMVASDDTAFHAANAIIAAYITMARANEAGIIADYDTEFLHDYRIALRKIRSVLSLFQGVYQPDQTEVLKASFSAMMVPTGRLRDLDVYLLERRQYYGLLPKILHGGLDAMFSMFTKERKAETDKLARHFRTKSYKQQITDLVRLFGKRKKLEPGPNADRGAHDYACALIWKRYRKICKIAAAIGAETDDAEVHELRIQCKKLRYLMEFFATLFPKPEFKSILKPLKYLQENLGLINDCAVQQISLQDFLRGLSKRPDSMNIDVAQSVGALIAVLHRRLLEERAKVLDSFALFDRPPTQKTFHNLFQTLKEIK